MALHCSTLAWKIPWTEEPGWLQTMGSLRVGHDWATSLSLFTHWRRKWQPTPVFLPGESQGRGSLGGCCLWGRPKSDTTKQLSSSSSSSPVFLGAVTWIFHSWALHCNAGLWVWWRTWNWPSGHLDLGFYTWLGKSDLEQCMHPAHSCILLCRDLISSRICLALT